MKKRRFKSIYMVIMEVNSRASAPLLDYILPLFFRKSMTGRLQCDYRLVTNSIRPAVSAQAVSAFGAELCVGVAGRAALRAKSFFACGFRAALRTEGGVGFNNIAAV